MAAPRRRLPLFERGQHEFPWILAKAFLSSPAALLDTIRERIHRLGTRPAPAQRREIEALRRLESLAARADDTHSAKYAKLADVAGLALRVGRTYRLPLVAATAGRPADLADTAGGPETDRSSRRPRLAGSAGAVAGPSARPSVPASWRTGRGGP